MEFYEFVQWCFRSVGASICTIIVISVILNGITEIVKVLKK